MARGTLPLRKPGRTMRFCRSLRTLRRSVSSSLRGNSMVRMRPQREAFVLRYVEGYTYDEIARLTGSGVDALKMRVHRARKVLQTTLQDEYAIPNPQ